MKDINILSLINAYDNLDKELYKTFLNFYKISIKNSEITDLKAFINNLIKIKKDIQLLSYYFIGYKIPQIGKEFDLLRFGKNHIINIELKRSSTKDKIKEQLVKNRYYLKFLKKTTYLFTYVHKENILYYIQDDNLQEVDFNFLIEKLYSQEIENIENINKLFNPTHYLVSPFNTTEKFIKNEYFLTQQQRSFKEEILKIIIDTEEANFFAITGSAGTGKTLLTYDIAKTLIDKNKKVLIIHCGILNKGQEKLHNDYGWSIIPIKGYNSYDINNYDLIILDEVQRIYPKQLKDIVKKINDANNNCIFSYDKEQTLIVQEEKNNIDDKIKKIQNLYLYKLSEKIRTNKDVANFIKMLFNKNKKDIKIYNKNNLYITFYKNAGTSKEYQKKLQREGWKIIQFTPSQYRNYHYEKFFIDSDSSHKIIGQEFDNIVAVIDDRFYYNDNGKLQYWGSAYYHPIKMLFQNLTRARKKIYIIIVNNQEVLNRCLEILSE